MHGRFPNGTKWYRYLFKAYKIMLCMHRNLKFQKCDYIIIYAADQQGERQNKSVSDRLVQPA